MSGKRIISLLRHDEAFLVRQKPIEKDQRKFPVDIFEGEKKVRVIAELPGVNKEDIRLDLNGATLNISASRGNRTYYKNVKLPCFSESIIGKIYNNGILEVTLY